MRFARPNKRNLYNRSPRPSTQPFHRTTRMPRYTQNPPAKYLRKITTLDQAYFSVSPAKKQQSPRMRMLSRNILFFLFLGLSAVAFTQEATLQFNQWSHTKHAAANEILAYTPAIGASEIRATISTPLSDCSSAYFSVTGPTHLRMPGNHLSIKIGRQERVLVSRDARRPDRFKLDAAIVQRIKIFHRMEVTIDGQTYEFSLAGSHSALSSLTENCDTLSREKQAQDIVAVRNSVSSLQLEKEEPEKELIPYWLHSRSYIPYAALTVIGLTFALIALRTRARPRAATSRPRDFSSDELRPRQNDVHPSEERSVKTPGDTDVALTEHVPAVRCSACRSTRATRAN